MKKKKSKFLDEFKTFIMRGNVMDLAVGVIIGGAFQGIIKSLVDDIISPILGIILKGIDFSQLSFDVGNATIKYGLFINSVISFLIMAFVIFLFIKAINKVFRRDKEETPEVKPAITVKVCPYCMSEININALKCPCCTSDLS